MNKIEKIVQNTQNWGSRIERKKLGKSHRAYKAEEIIQVLQNRSQMLRNYSSTFFPAHAKSERFAQTLKTLIWSPGLTAFGEIFDAAKRHFCAFTTTLF